MANTKKLPKWLSVGSDAYGRAVFIIDPDVVYPALLKELADKQARTAELLRARVDAGDESAKQELADLPMCDPEQPDQYWLEVVYQCAKLEAIRHILESGIDPRPTAALQLCVRPKDESSKSRWALRNYPAGRGAFAATQGREARYHYLGLRGYIPQ